MVERFVEEVVRIGVIAEEVNEWVTFIDISVESDQRTNFGFVQRHWRLFS